MKRNLVCAGMALLATACVPISMTYFRPTGDGQVILGYPCGGSPDTLRIKLPHGVSADISVMRMPGESLRAAVSYYIPTGTSVRLVSGTMTVVDTVSASRQELTPASVRQQCGTGPEDYGCERNVPPTTPMDGATVKDGSLFGLGKSDRGLFYDVDVPFAAEALAITPPDIEINGVLVHMNEVAFNERTTTEWTGICQ
jgi:hypothetical protein